MNEKPYHNEPGFEQVATHLILLAMLFCFAYLLNSKLESLADFHQILAMIASTDIHYLALDFLKVCSEFQQFHWVTGVFYVLNHTQHLWEHLSEVSVAECCLMKSLEF